MSSLESTAWLEQFLKSWGGVAGTVHIREGQNLRMEAAVNIPPNVMEVTKLIPFGKGMAGLAFERDTAVQTCDLKGDKSGDVRAGAKAVDAHAAVALPIHDAKGDVRGVVGIAFMDEREIGPTELTMLGEAAEKFAG